MITTLSIFKDRLSRMSNLQDNLTITLQETKIVENMLRNESRKRKRLNDEENIPPAKRPRIMTWVSKRFIQKCKEYRERKRKIVIGLFLYLDSQTRDIRRMARKRASSEPYADYEGLVKAKYPKLSQISTITKLQQTVPTLKVTAAAAIAQAIINAVKLEEKIKNEMSAPVQKRRKIRRLSKYDNEEVTEVKVAAGERKMVWRKAGWKQS